MSTHIDRFCQSVLDIIDIISCTNCFSHRQTIEQKQCSLQINAVKSIEIPPKCRILSVIEFLIGVNGSSDLSKKNTYTMYVVPA